MGHLKENGNLAKIIASRSPLQLKKTSTRMCLAIKIYDTIKDKHIDIDDFCKHMKISREECDDWLAGQTDLSVNTLVEIEDYLKIKLFNIEEDEA